MGKGGTRGKSQSDSAQNESVCSLIAALDAGGGEFQESCGIPGKAVEFQLSAPAEQPAGLCQVPDLMLRVHGQVCLSQRDFSMRKAEP